MKQLVESSHNISVDRNISVSKYFKSGRELIKAASNFEDKGELEKAFVLYLRYVTLFLEKIIHHPEYSKADPAEKSLVKNECNNILDRAESLKRRLLDKFTSEYELSLKESTVESSGADSIQKRSVKLDGSYPHKIAVDDFDKMFDFSQQPSDGHQINEFDPFNIEQLKQSFETSEKR